MKYDDASWHSGGDFPSDLPSEAGATHIGMFLAWAATRGLVSEYHAAESLDELSALKVRLLTPASWFLSACDGKFTDEDLTDEANAFASIYYGSGDVSGLYVNDHSSLFDSYDNIYRVPDTWATFDSLAPVLDRRFNDWKTKADQN